jgi:hypothetical protein
MMRCVNAAPFTRERTANLGADQAEPVVAGAEQRSKPALLAGKARSITMAGLHPGNAYTACSYGRRRFFVQQHTFGTGGRQRTLEGIFPTSQCISSHTAS